MANTLHGPYVPTTWISGATPTSQATMSNLEKQNATALASLNPDLVGSGFVLSGVGVTRHNSYASNVASQIASANLKRYYRLDETAAFGAADSSGNAIAGTYTNNPTLGVPGLLTGDSDTCATFAAASSQYVNVPVGGLPTGNGAISFGCWMKFAANPASTQVLMLYGTTGTHNVFSLLLLSTGHVAVDDGGGTGTVISTGALATGTSHFVVGTWDGTTMVLWVDGVSQGTATPGAQTIPSSATTCNIGANTTPANFFSGQLDEVIITNTALNNTQITTLYTAGTTATQQVDVASGAAYLVQSDGTLARCDVGTTSETTVTPSTTYFLDLNPDGSWSWATSHSAVTNHLTIASVTTDGSGNVNLITDLRPLNIALFPAATGLVNGMGVIAKASRVAVTTTAQQTILTCTLPASGTYRINFALMIGNGATSSPLLYAAVGNSARSQTDTAYAIGFSANDVTALDGVHASYLAKWGNANLFPTIIDANPGSLTVFYQAAAGTPNDLVSVVVERIA